MNLKYHQKVCSVLLCGLPIVCALFYLQVQPALGGEAGATWYIYYPTYPADRNRRQKKSGLLTCNHSSQNRHTKS